MKTVGKYNLFKGVSTLLTFGTPLVTLFCTSNFFIYKEGPAVSAAGVFVLLILLCLFKDKLAENFKLPSAFILSATLLALLLLIQSILVPIKTICLTTMIATGVDEMSFKRLYKQIELTLPKEAAAYKHVGFLFVTTNKLEGK